MAKNGAHGNGTPGRVKTATPPTVGLWTKRDTSTGRFEKAKREGGSFRGVEREV